MLSVMQYFLMLTKKSICLKLFPPKVVINHAVNGLGVMAGESRHSGGVNISSGREGSEAKEDRPCNSLDLHPANVFYEDTLRKAKAAPQTLGLIGKPH